MITKTLKEKLMSPFLVMTGIGLHTIRSSFLDKSTYLFFIILFHRLKKIANGSVLSDGRYSNLISLGLESKSFATETASMMLPDMTYLFCNKIQCQFSKYVLHLQATHVLRNSLERNKWL